MDDLKVLDLRQQLILLRAQYELVLLPLMVMKNGQLMQEKRRPWHVRSRRLRLLLICVAGRNLARHPGQSHHRRRNGVSLWNPPVPAGDYLDHHLGLCPLE